MARKQLVDLPNHKQCTVADYYGIDTGNAHRACDDAEVCGQIAIRLLEKCEAEERQKEQQKQKAIPNEDEKIDCATVYDILSRSGHHIEWLRFRKNSGGYVEALCLYPFLKFKHAKKGQYLLAAREIAETKRLPIEMCSAAEGGSDVVRVYYLNTKDIEDFSDWIVNEYIKSQSAMMEYTGRGARQYKEAKEIADGCLQLTQEEVDRLRIKAKHPDKEQEEKVIHIEKPISRDTVLINPVHLRCPYKYVRNFDDSHKGYTMGSPFYFEGEEERKKKNHSDALRLFDQARMNGYDAPALYHSYAMLFRQMKEYDDEIAILDEAIERDVGKKEEFEARRQKAIMLLMKTRETK